MTSKKSVVKLRNVYYGILWKNKITRNVSVHYLFYKTRNVLFYKRCYCSRKLMQINSTVCLDKILFTFPILDVQNYPLPPYRHFNNPN